VADDRLRRTAGQVKSLSFGRWRDRHGAAGPAGCTGRALGALTGHGFERSDGAWHEGRAYRQPGIGTSGVSDPEAQAPQALRGRDSVIWSPCCAGGKIGGVVTWPSGFRHACRCCGTGHSTQTASITSAVSVLEGRRKRRADHRPTVRREPWLDAG